MKLTVGQLLINESLPKPIRDLNRVLTGKNITEFLTDIAVKHPAAYPNVVFNIKKIGDDAAFESAHSVTLNDFKPAPERDVLLKKVEVQAAEIRKTESDPAKRDAKIVDAYDTLRPELEEAVLQSGLKKDYGLHEMILSKSRGNKNQLNNLVGAKMIIRDALGNPVMVPINHSFSEGLESHEYWSDSYGTRKGVISAKIATAEGGYLGKKLSTPLLDMIVTENDCGTLNGIMMDVKDPHVVDRFLAKDAGPYKRGDIVSPTMASKLESLKVSQILVRSPLTCLASKGVCARCYGLTFNGKLPPIGHPVGLQAAQTIAEPIAQGALSEKHSGGVAAKKELPADFKTLQSFTEVPEKFPYGATLSEKTGVVGNIHAAPQGGTYVYVEGHKHYVPADREVKVKTGDDIDAGDQISSGWRNPAEIVRLKGAGAGRADFAKQYALINNTAYQTNSDMRHYEIYGRALVNHAVAEKVDEESGTVPGDVVNLDYLASQVSTENSHELPIEKCRGKYFAASYLHHMKGDLVDRQSIEDLKKAGIVSINVYDTKPPISPIMQRVSDVAASNQDWMARLAGEGLKKSLVRAITRGEVSNVHSNHPIPALAIGTELGQTGEHGEY